jgi:multisubunit Na+/H+ antiporter MnhG subunit
MPWDIRVPIGLMFVLMGALLAGYGLLGRHDIYARSLGLNINLIWGTVLVVMGAVLFVLGTRPGRAR